HLNCILLHSSLDFKAVTKEEECKEEPCVAIISSMANKTERQGAIREIVETKVVESQEDLRKLLRQRGWDVTQSTLSRDLREMRLARIPTPEGVRYTFPEGASGAESRFGIEGVLPQFLDRIDGVAELLVLKPVSGGAQAV